MTKKDKLKRLLGGLDTFDDQIKGTFKSLDEEMARVSQTLKETITAKTLDQVNSEFSKLGGKFKMILETLGNLQVNLQKLQANLSEREAMYVKRLAEEINTLSEEWKVLRTKDGKEAVRLAAEIAFLRQDLDAVAKREIPDFGRDIKQVETSLRKIIQTWNTDELEAKVDSNRRKVSEELEDLSEKLDKLRKDMLSMVSRQRGGNANRNISIGGNSSVLSKYTDINLKAGSNVTLTYTNNDNTKNLDITIAATGGAGTVRSIDSISTSQTAGDTAGTDYVYVATAGVALTLPTAVGNENLYTIKNASVSSVLVATTGGQTIDSDANVILATQYTAVDLISDNANWHIT